MLKIISNSSTTTQKVARLFAKELSKEKIRTARVIALHGNLGAGKTTFIQGFLRGLGVKSKITSPTFVILKNYKIKKGNYAKAYHIDCYRIQSSQEILDLGFKEIISNPGNIVLVEWPERISAIMPKNATRINFKYGKKENERTLQIR